MAPPVSPVSDASSPLRAAQDLLAELKDRRSATSVSFDQALEASRAATDIVELRLPALDPSASPLFQAHAGSGSQAVASPPDALTALDRPDRQRVPGIEASTAAGAFSSSQSPGAAGILPQAGPATAQRPAAAPGGGFGDLLGTRLDLRA